jgi:hypothetical protein
VQSAWQFVRTPAVRYLFGDSYGLLLFCAVLVAYLATWQIGFFINDNFTIANALVGVSDGHLYVERAIYGNEGLQSPGMFLLDGQYYGRNYGQVVLALPLLWLIQAVAAVVSLRVAIAATWGLLVLAAAWIAAGLVDENLNAYIDLEAALLYAGSTVALAGFLFAIYGATPINPVNHYLMALQAQTMVAAGFVGVVTYRLLTRVSNRRVGLAAGAGIALSAPIGYWASIPKRHVLVALCVILAAYLLYRSREPYDDADQQRTLVVGTRTVSITDATLFRALTYVPVGLLAWINAGEGLLLLLAVLAVDLPTGSRDLRSLAAVVTAGVLSAVPMLVTNSLISGNPFLPPQAIQQEGEDFGSTDGSGSGGTGGGQGETGGGQGGTDPETGGSLVGDLVDIAVDGISVIAREAGAGFTALTTQTEEFVPLLIRSSYQHGISYFSSTETIRLSVLESLPVAAALLVLPILLWRLDVRHHLRSVLDRKTLSPVRTVDAFSLLYVVLVGLVFAPRLTSGSQVTGRYVLAAYPALVYGVARLPAVKRVLTEQTWTTAATYLAGVGIGTQLLFVWIFRVGPSLGEASQIHGTIGFGAAVLVAGWILLDAVGIERDRLGAIALGLAAASGTAFVLLVKLWYFSYGRLAIAFF